MFVAIEEDFILLWFRFDDRRKVNRLQFNCMVYTCTSRVLLFLLEDELVGKLGGVIDPIEDLSAHVVDYYFF